MNWQDASVAGTGILMVTVIASVLLWQIFKTAQVKLPADGRAELEAQYRQSIADVTAAQQVTAARLAELSESVHDVRDRVISIDKVLKEVE